MIIDPIRYVPFPAPVTQGRCRAIIDVIDAERLMLDAEHRASVDRQRAGLVRLCGWIGRAGA